jgi:RHS repeat-associated protein
MTRTAQEQNSLTHQRATHVRRPLSPWRYAARLAVLVCACLAASSPALGQNVQFTQGNVGSGLENTMQISIAAYPGRGATSLPVTLYYSSQVWRIGYKKTVRVNSALRNSVTEAIYAERSAAGWTTSLDVPVIEWPKADDYYWYNGKPTHTVVAGFDYKVANLFVHIPDGSTHELRKADAVYAVNGPGVDMQGDFYAVDGSRMRFHGVGDGTGTLYLSDGSRYELEEGGEVKLIDRNGNTLLYDAQNRRWTDTLGTILRGYITQPWPASPQAGTDYSYTPPGFAAPYVFKWRSLSDVLTPAQPGQQPTPQLRPASDYYLPNPNSDPTDWNAGNFPQPVPTPGPTPLFYSAATDDTSPPTFTYVVGRGQGVSDLFNPAVLAEVVLPNGLSYKFTYNEYGEIDKVVYPTGGYERLKYDRVPAIGSVQVPYDEASRGVRNRWVSPNGTGGADELPWTYETASSANPSALVVQMTAPDGTYTETYRHSIFNPNGNFGYQDARNGMTFDERVYSKKPALGGVMLQRSLTEWTQSSFGYTGPVPPGQPLQPINYTAYRNARPSKTISLMLDTGGAALAKRITYSYGASDPANAVLIEKTTGFDKTGMTESHFAEVDHTTAEEGALATISNYTFPPAGSTTTVYLNDEAYRSRNLLGLVTSVTMSNSAGQPVSKTETFYDEGGYGLITYGDLAGDASYIDPATSARGNPTTVRRYVDASASVAQGDECPVGVCLQTHAQFDQAGNPFYFWDERGVQSEKEYSADYKRAFLTKTTSAVPDPDGEHGSQTAFTSVSTYEPETGLVLATSDVNGGVTEYRYGDGGVRDPLNRPRMVIRPDLSWTKTDYNDVPGNLYVHTESQLDVGRTTHAYQFFDKLGRASRSFTRELGASYVVAETQYDNMGRVSRTSNPVRTTVNGSGDPRQAPYWVMTVQPSLWTTTDYDERGRIKKVTLPDSTFVTTEYAGIYTTVTDQAGRQRRQKTNALGRIVRVDEPDANGSLGDKNSPAQPSFYEYDALGNIVRINQGLAQAGANPEDYNNYIQHRYFKYDALSRLTHERQIEQAGTITTAADPLTGNTTWSRQLTYDEPRGGVNNMGLLSKAEDARHVYSFFHYDQLGRNFRIDYSGGTPSVLSKYDQARTDAPPAGEQAVVFKNKGRLTEVTTVEVTTGEGWVIPQTQQLHDYDLMGRSRRQRQVVGADTYELRYDFNLGGGLVSERYPSGRVLTFSYDDGGRLLSADCGANPYATAITYTQVGELESMTLGNGVVYSMAYGEARSQLSSITLTQGTNVLQKYEYKYGAVDMGSGAVDETKNNGQLARIEGTIGTQRQWQQRFQYDSLGRLAAAGEYYGETLQNRSYLLNYDYDVYGNRYQKQSRNQNNQVAQSWVEDGAYAATTNRLNAGLVYDDAGNVTTDSRFRQRKYEYDANNRQRKSSNLDDTGATRSVYNGLGQRVAMLAGGQVTRVLVYDAGGDLVAEYGGAVFTNGTQYVMEDQQGTPRLTMTSAPVNSQFVLARQDYLPFGEDVPGSVGLRTGVTGYDQATNPRQRYAGMERDEATGMSHTLWREFDSLSARWTAPDPYGGSMEVTTPQSFNRYTYVNNDPVNKVDPAGLMLSDIGVVQTDNPAVAMRLERALVTVLRRYMDGQTGRAQQQQRNAAFARSQSANSRFANYFSGEAGGADAASSGSSGSDSSSSQGQADTASDAGSPLSDGATYEQTQGGNVGFGRVTAFNRQTNIMLCQVFVRGQLVRVYQGTGVSNDNTLATVVYSTRTGPALGRTTVPHYGVYGTDHRGHIIARALGGPAIGTNLFSQSRGINVGLYRSFEYDIRRTLTQHRNWVAHIEVHLFYPPPTCEPPSPGVNYYRPTGGVYTVTYREGNAVRDIRIMPFPNP